jgi:hypothetical protein
VVKSELVDRCLVSAEGLTVERRAIHNWQSMMKNLRHYVCDDVRGYTNEGDVYVSRLAYVRQDRDRSQLFREFFYSARRAPNEGREREVMDQTDGLSTHQADLANSDYRKTQWFR